VKAGKLRCIATGTTQRIAQLPDVPTVAEQGYPGFEMTQWYGLMAPANFAAANVDKLAAAAARAVREPAALERLNGATRDRRRRHAGRVRRLHRDRARALEAVLARAKVKPD